MTQFAWYVFFFVVALFIVGYVVYAFIFHQRLRKLNQTYFSPQNRHLFVLSWVQGIIAFLLAATTVVFFLNRL